MADKKISALTPASLPLAGSEVLPIVQGGVTVKVATDNLTAKNFRSNATNGIRTMSRFIPYISALRGHRGSGMPKEFTVKRQSGVMGANISGRALCRRTTGR